MPPLRDRQLLKAAMLAGALNACPGSAKQKRLLALLEDCRQLEALVPEVQQGRPLGTVAGHPSTLIYDLREHASAASLVERINRQLSHRRYRFRRVIPVTLLVENGEPSLESWQVTIPPVPFAKQEGGGAVEEPHAVELLLDLMQAGGLDRLRVCPICRRWFAASRTDQQYCSFKCGRDKYRQEHKAKLAKYMKGYRAKERKRDKLLLPARKRR